VRQILEELLELKKEEDFDVFFKPPSKEELTSRFEEYIKGLDPSIGQLDLNGNQIKDISALAGLKNLKRLSLDDNQIKDISALAGLKNLEYLSLSDNQIKDISALAGLKNLQTFDLSDNQIKDISALAGLKSLIWLNLNNNQISEEQIEWLKKILKKTTIVS